MPSLTLPRRERVTHAIPGEPTIVKHKLITARFLLSGVTCVLDPQAASTVSERGEAGK